MLVSGLGFTVMFRVTYNVEVLGYGYGLGFRFKLRGLGLELHFWLGLYLGLLLSYMTVAFLPCDHFMLGRLLHLEAESEPGPSTAGGEGGVTHIFCCKAPPEI